MRCCQRTWKLQTCSLCWFRRCCRLQRRKYSVKTSPLYQGLLIELRIATIFPLLALRSLHMLMRSSVPAKITATLVASNFPTTASTSSSILMVAVLLLPALGVVALDRENVVPSIQRRLTMQPLLIWTVVKPLQLGYCSSSSRTIRLV